MALAKSFSTAFREIRRRRKSAQRNSLNGVVSLGKSTRAPQFTSKAAVRVVDEIADRFRDRVEAPPLAFLVVRMHPAAVVDHDPERLALEHPEIRDHVDQHMALAFLQERARQVMMVDDVMALLRAKDDRDHVPAQILALFLALVFAPAPPLLLDFVPT